MYSPYTYCRCDSISSCIFFTQLSHKYFLHFIFFIYSTYVSLIFLIHITQRIMTIEMLFVDIVIVANEDLPLRSQGQCQGKLNWKGTQMSILHPHYSLETPRNQVDWHFTSGLSPWLILGLWTDGGQSPFCQKYTFIKLQRKRDRVTGLQNSTYSHNR